MDRFQRTRLLYGDSALNAIRNSTVAVFGIGGVGGHCAESLVRCGVKRIILCDRDVVDVTNLNRQVVAFDSTIGKPKTEVMSEICRSISPDVEVVTFQHSFSDDFGLVFDNYEVDCVADCIDDVRAKVNLIVYCKEHGIDIVSSMGTAQRLHPELLTVTDVFKTSYDPLARIMRRELKQRNIRDLTVVTSTEAPQKRTGEVLASAPFVPGAAGLTLASVITEKLIQKGK